MLLTIAILLIPQLTPITRDAVVHVLTRVLASRHSDRQGYITQYADCFDGQVTANGTVFRQNRISCAATFVPLETWLEVRYGTRTLIVQVTDTGDLAWNQIDVSRAGARVLGLYRLVNGHVDRRVTYRILSRNGGGR